MQPNAEMSYCHVGFDLKAARQMCDRYTSWKTLNLHPECEPRCVSDAARELPAALDEIERQANRIAELEVDNQKWREYNQQLYRANRKKHAALKKLGQAKRERGKALVEERARFNVVMKVVPLNTSFPNSDHKKAREQLRREGKL